MLIDLATGTSRPVVDQTPTLSSNRTPWDGVFLEEHAATGPLELVDMAPPDAVVIIQLAPEKVCEWKDSAGSRELRFTRGQVHIIPAMYPFTMRARHSGNILSVAVESRFLRCAAHELCRGPERLELRHEAPLDDPLLRELAMAMKREVTEGCPTGKVYGETLGAAMATHLVRHYSNLSPANRVDRASGFRRQIRQAIYYIHDHLSSDISLNILAAHVSLSPFHFARLFKDSTGLAPHQYVVQCRVERARELLLSSAKTTAEVALNVGFCDQSHLTTHFKRAFGLTPKKFRQQMLPPR